MKKLYQIKILRRLILPVLEKLKLRDITIRHHWTNDRLTLHPFKHKGYWYHGKKRECESMALFSELIKKGDHVIEIGGHIGYISLYFSRLVGPEGLVTVFEPGPNNLPYIRKNTKDNKHIFIIEKAVTDYTGTSKLYIEDLSGQNNSLLEEYVVLNENAHNMGIDSIEKSVCEIPCTTFEDFIFQAQVPTPSFIKIDVEGAELNVLNGMKDTLKRDDIALMVEVTHKAGDVFSLLIDAGFKIFWPNKHPIENFGDVRGNVFCLKGNDERIRFFSSKSERRYVLNA